MKVNEIKEFETGESCFGEILRVNGIEYEDLKEEDILLVVNEMFKNDINRGSLLKECFKLCLEHLQADLIDSHTDNCDQCGNWNSYNKYKCEE